MKEWEIDGIKKKTNKGSMTMEIKSSIVMDHRSKWDYQPMNKFLRGVYNKYVIPSRVDEIRDKVRDDGRDFKEILKTFVESSGKR